jgi:eukaryotic-like serine/threonine-protein kinase
VSVLRDAALERLRSVADEPDLTGTRYRLIERVGEGGMGVVYRAHDRELARDVALKVVSLPGAEAPGTEERLRREAQILARLEHPGIVPVHDVGVLADGRLYYAMKLVRGRRLDAHLRAEPSLPEALRVFARICETVAFAHDRGVLHRDLKPENVMVGGFGEVLVLDWGLAKLMGRDEPEPRASATAPAQGATAHGTVLGTPGFMAPEQARGELDRIDERSDVYALGALLRWTLAGGAPGPSEEPGAPAAARAEAHGPFADAAPKPLLAVCAKALDPDPAERYPSVRDLAADVARYLDGRAVAAYPEGLLERVRRLLRVNRALLALIAAYLAVRILLLLVR